jgi:hypothetical protein
LVGIDRGASVRGDLSIADRAGCLASGEIDLELTQP